MALPSRCYHCQRDGRTTKTRHWAKRSICFFYQNWQIETRFFYPVYPSPILFECGVRQGVSYASLLKNVAVFSRDGSHLCTKDPLPASAYNVTRAPTRVLRHPNREFGMVSPGYLWGTPTIQLPDFVPSLSDIVRLQVVGKDGECSLSLLNKVVTCLPPSVCYL